eukprot:CAMPEP_0179426428 /NCGR_PEP_ID=MMETSP0799-20121207/12730_1 /TAXON_ID=46947 /ORGANISM="Geminigera cryophila, Strain CCMP2564" /LENGTH=104 /DNA_ID=CAMNT_0021201173 /DNA_START=510 /DNA_END=821 /DNA_ORIENTATION=-
MTGANCFSSGMSRASDSSAKKGATNDSTEIESSELPSPAARAESRRRPGPLQIQEEQTPACWLGWSSLYMPWGGKESPCIPLSISSNQYPSLIPLPPAEHSTFS